ncbi:hypothetical protein HanIR_Chr13g0631101 [Helianthus annuus]|nr:hypothetical protein HanIR_Chr13g0631101 [Helianthus annuus]
MESCRYDTLWCHYKLAACANHGQPSYTNCISSRLTCHLNIFDATTNQSKNTPDSFVFIRCIPAVQNVQRTKLYY